MERCCLRHLNSVAIYQKTIFLYYEPLFLHGKKRCNLFLTDEIEQQ